MTVVLTSIPAVPLAHLAALTDDQGLFEHAQLRTPRRHRGYCTDDVARALGVVSGDHADSSELARLRGIYLDFVDGAVSASGAVHNRRSVSGQWTDRPTRGDWWGRAIAGLGATVLSGASPGLQERAHRIFLRAAQVTGTDVRSCAFAAKGAIDVLAADPQAVEARGLLVECLERIPHQPTADWRWPEPRLRYANGALCSALIEGGSRLGRDDYLSDGLDMLHELLRIESSPSGHLSVTGSAGRGPDDAGPLWDQQPIEVAAIAAACLAALRCTGESQWVDHTLRAWSWFAGDNDGATLMFDPLTGAGFDGLERAGRNENCGAESTLAALATAECARRAEGSRA